MIALIDADILPYEFGGMIQLEEPDKPLEWEIVRSMVDDRIQQIKEAVGASVVRLYLTDSKSNFRLNTATILPYKGNRNLEKPHHWSAIRQHLIDNYNAEVQYGIEADDRLGIEQMKDFNFQKAINEEARDLGHTSEVSPVSSLFVNTVICSRDKDLRMIPGWHYVWPAGKQKEELFFQDELSAIRFFYGQLLTGDRSTDNILGLFGVGASSKLVQRLEDFDQELDMFKHVFKAYQDRFGSYAYDFLLENATLLWILREDNHQHPDTGAYVFPETEIEERIERLMEEMGDGNMG